MSGGKRVVMLRNNMIILILSLRFIQTHRLSIHITLELRLIIFYENITCGKSSITYMPWNIIFETIYINTALNCACPSNKISQERKFGDHYLSR